MVEYTKLDWVFMTGMIFDSEQIQVDLLDTEWLEGVGRILTFGSKKYAADNWRQGISYRRLIGACFRHLFSFAQGKTTDAETGESHLLHASCCLMFLYWMTLHKPELNDFYWQKQIND